MKKLNSILPQIAITAALMLFISCENQNDPSESHHSEGSGSKPESTENKQGSGTKPTPTAPEKSDSSANNNTEEKKPQGSSAKKSSGTPHVHKERSKEEKDALRKKLTEIQYHVAVEDGTERAFANPYWDNKEEGIYVDIISGKPLFSSKEKFKSGTGWPSFWKPLDKTEIVEIVDRKFGMVRTEVRSKTGNTHLGHVFPDGPDPTGLRYCINSASLRFVAKEELEKEGLADYTKLFSGKSE